MNHDAPRENVHTPQYLDEVEAMLGMTAFQDEDRQNKLYGDISMLEVSEIGSRALMYTAGLRILARTRAEDRNLDPAASTMTAQEWNEKWRPGTKRIELIAQLATADIRPIARRLKILQDLEDNLQYETSADSPLLPHQHPYLESIVKFMQSGSSRLDYYDKNGRLMHKMQHGATVIGPTGIGKTVLEARAIVAMGIGQKVEGASRHEDRRRAVLVAPTQQLVRQFAGQTGDDTFRRFAPNVTVGTFYADSKQLDSDIIVTTIDHFNAYFRDNKLAGETVDAIIIDEVHHLMEPGFRETLLCHWDGPTIGFTATAAYSEERDVRMILPHTIYHGDTIKYIEDGVLNGAQLYLLRVDPYEHRDKLPNNIDLNNENIRREVTDTMLETAVVDFALDLIRKGRRGIIYSPPGDESASARRIADTLQNAREPDGSPIILPDGKPIRAEALGTFRARDRQLASNPEVIEAYNNRDLHVLSSVDYGREGLNADIDFVLISAEVKSQLKMAQIIGRGTRLSERFPTTIYAQFVTPKDTFSDRHEERCTIFDIFGMTEVEQGIELGPLDRRSVTLNQRTNNPLLVYNELPDNLLTFSEPLNGRPIGEAHVVSQYRIEVPPDYISLEILQEKLQVQDDYAVKMLSQAGYRWVGRFELVDSQRVFKRYFEPAVRDFIENRYGKEAATSGMVSVGEFSATYGIDRSMVGQTVRLLQSQGKLEFQVRRNASGIPTRYLDETAQAALRQSLSHIIDTKDIQPGDIVMSTCAKELNISSGELQKRAQIVIKRSANGRYIRVIEAAEVERLRAEKSQPKEYWTRANISALADVDFSFLANRMTDEEIALGKPHPHNSRLVWTADEARIIAERLRGLNGFLPADLIPLTVICDLVNISDKPIRKYGLELNNEPRKIKLRGVGPPVNCYTWQFLQACIARFDWRGPQDINFDMLPAGPDDIDSEKINYARGLQVMLYPVDRLGLSADQLSKAADTAQRIRNGDFK